MRLKEIREARGISQRQAALGLNLSPTVYNRYENGLREPSNALLPVIADFFGVTVDELLGRPAGEEKNNQPRTPEARIVSGWMDDLPEERRQQLQNMMKAVIQSFPEFQERKDDHDDNPA